MPSILSAVVFNRCFFSKVKVGKTSKREALFISSPKLPFDVIGHLYPKVTVTPYRIALMDV